MQLDTESAVIEYTRGARHIYREIAGEHLLIDLRSRSEVPFFALTASGVRLWEALAAWMTVDALVDGLRGIYEVSAEEADRDVREFLAQLASIDALTDRERSE
ncbi:MAG: PqqD family protein [Gemmatimonadaceae bacterium]